MGLRVLQTLWDRLCRLCFARAHLKGQRQVVQRADCPTSPGPRAGVKGGGDSMDGFSLGANYWSRQGGPLMWTQFNPQVVREELKAAKSMGLTTLRWFLYWPDFEPSPGVDNEACWAHVDEFLSLVQEAGLKTFPTLLVGHMSGQNWDPLWREGRDLWTDPWMLDHEESFIRRAVTRLSSYDSVAGWVLTNEWPLYAGKTTPEVFDGWIRRMVQAVRDHDMQNRPITMGDGLWNAMGVDNGIAVELLSRAVDIVGPHVYPENEDALAVAMASYVHCALAQGENPVLLEEFGTTDAFGSADGQAAFYRSQLTGALMAGAVGAWAWCLTDFDLPQQLPYAHHPFELTFGLMTTTGQRKATGDVMHQFAEVSQGFGAVQHDATGILVPALQTAMVPFARGPEGVLQTRVAQAMLMTLAQLGFNPRVLREPMPSQTAIIETIPTLPELDDCSVIFLVAPRIGEPLRQRLWDWVERGGHLYVAYSHTFWFPQMKEQLGVRYEGRYNVIETLSGPKRLTCHFGDTIDFTLPPGMSVPFVTLGAQGAEVWAHLEDERPVLFRYQVGRGSIVTNAVGWEASPVRLESLLALYQSLLAALNIYPDIQIVGTSTQLARSTTGRIIAMNHGERPSGLRSRAGSLRDQDGTPCPQGVTLAPHTWWSGYLS
ncbi:hypothetical protein CO251_05770 [Sulfobacillus sp. hq2]|nr:hypothetical protein CO251_05770 [Sulfobacillus sp. hq2]